jgi:hypothetical protein
MTTGGMMLHRLGNAIARAVSSAATTATQRRWTTGFFRTSATDAIDVSIPLCGRDCGDSMIGKQPIAREPARYYAADG